MPPQSENSTNWLIVSHGEENTNFVSKISSILSNLKEVIEHEVDRQIRELHQPYSEKDKLISELKLELAEVRRIAEKNVVEKEEYKKKLNEMEALSSKLSKVERKIRWVKILNKSRGNLLKLGRRESKKSSLKARQAPKINEEKHKEEPKNLPATTPDVEEDVVTLSSDSESDEFFDSNITFRTLQHEKNAQSQAQSKLANLTVVIPKQQIPVTADFEDIGSKSPGTSETMVNQNRPTTPLYQPPPARSITRTSTPISHHNSHSIASNVAFDIASLWLPKISDIGEDSTLSSQFSRQKSTLSEENHGLTKISDSSSNSLGFHEESWGELQIDDQEDNAQENGHASQSATSRKSRNSTNPNHDDEIEVLEKSSTIVYKPAKIIGDRKRPWSNEYQIQYGEHSLYLGIHLQDYCGEIQQALNKGLQPCLHYIRFNRCKYQQDCYYMHHDEMTTGLEVALSALKEGRTSLINALKSYRAQRDSRRSANILVPLSSKSPPQKRSCAPSSSSNGTSFRKEALDSSENDQDLDDFEWIRQLQALKN
uniref:C3H1-type domain-containing protein n=1 Tax=Acrobeloides nanus TaxID=290746 RepID=A0A914DWM2_9BILA